MFFPTSEYIKTCKIPTRCQVTSTVTYVEKFPEELKWFRRHDQFKHVFHMPKEPNHMLQGMWMLLVRTVKTAMKEECWFVVNGVPIRYSMKEHALLTGFSCQEYLEEWQKLGSEKFAKRVFKNQKTVKISDVAEKLRTMKRHSADRMKLMVLFFLCKVIKAKVKADGPIDPFLLRIVDDLSACESFPWGRYTFKDNIEGIQCFMRKLKGTVRSDSQPCFPGFIIPLEILAFECIPELERKFREVVPAEGECPRMCKHKFMKDVMKGYTLENINETLGSTKDIFSILEPDSDERNLLRTIVSDDVDDGLGYVDVVVDSWREHLIEKRKKIWWKDMYEKDVESRKENVGGEDGVDLDENVGRGDDGFEELKELCLKGFQKVSDQVGEMDAKVDTKLRELGSKVEELKEIVSAQGQAIHGLKGPSPTALSPYVRVQVTDPEPPRIVEVTEEEEKKENEKKENEEKEKKERMKNYFETGKKRQRTATTRYTPDDKRSKKNV